jgi:hypothetical protein
MDPASMEPDDARYLRAHAERSSAIVTSWLREHGASPELMTAVGGLVRHHETGGSPAADLVRVGSPPWPPALTPRRIPREPPRCTRRQRRSGRVRSSSFPTCTGSGCSRFALASKASTCGSGTSPFRSRVSAWAERAARRSRGAGAASGSVHAAVADRDRGRRGVGRSRPDLLRRASGAPPRPPQRRERKPSERQALRRPRGSCRRGPRCRTGSLRSAAVRRPRSRPPSRRSSPAACAWRYQPR